MRTVDWSQTRAAFHSMASRGIRLNVKGRDAVGCVEPQEALALAEEIKAKLLTLVDPDSGAALIKNAWTCDELFSGPYVASAADIYLEPAEGYSMHHGFAQSLVMPSTQHDHPRSGDHAFYGMFMAAGPAIATGKLTSASLQDITPTVLHLMGLPVSTDMDGAVLSEALRPEWLKDHEVRVIEEKPWQECAETEETDEEKLKERLRDLGYL